MDSGPTNGGCSGNALAARPSSPTTELDWRVTLRSAAATEAALGWASEDSDAKRELPASAGEEEEKETDREITLFMSENALRVTVSQWMAQGDHHLQECFVMKGGAKGQRIVVYFPEGEGHTSTIAAWKAACTRAKVYTRQSKTPPVAFPWPWRRALHQALVGEFLQTGKPMTLTKWGRLFRLFNPDNRRLLWAEFSCSRCQKRRKMGILATEAIMEAASKGGASCSTVGLVCAKEETDKTLPWTQPVAPPDSDEDDFCTLRPEEEKVFVPTKKERREEAMSPRKGDFPEEEDSPQEVENPQADSSQGSKKGERMGYSAGALRFYRSTGKALPLPDYNGASSEASFLAWKRGVERHFRTYGVEEEEERVGIAVDMLTGDALNWWNGLWMSGRDTAIETWEELQRRLRMRFLPPEGEMRVVGQWRRLQQTGTVAAYSDYVFRLQAMCSMQQGADFRLAFYGLRPELQGEVRRYMRRKQLQTLSLERLFEIATDAELSFGRQRGEKEKREEGGWRGIPEGARNRGAKINQIEVWKEGVAREGVNEARGSRGGPWGDSTRSSGSAQQGFRGGGSGEPCPICDESGLGWMTCRRRQRGKGCARCGSTSHWLARCPQRQRLPFSQAEGGIVMGQQEVGNSSESNTSDPWKSGGSTKEGVIYNLGVSLPYEMWGLQRTQLLTYLVKVHRRNVKAMLDSGATVNVIAERVLREVGGVMKPAAERVKFADGRLIRAEGVAEVSLTSRGHTEVVPCLVLRELDTDMLLGRPWLRTWNPTINWTTGELIFSDGVKWKACFEGGNEICPVRTGAGKTTPRLTEKTRRDVYVQQLQLIPEREPTPLPRVEDDNLQDEKRLPPYLLPFQDVFEEPQLVPGERPEVEHRLRLREPIEPIRKAPYRMAPRQKEALEAELRRFLQKRWIRPSDSPWATVALVVPKKDNTWRVCIDYRDLNAVTKMDAYPLPKIDELLNKLAQARVYSKMDLHSGFHQIPMEVASIPLTAFRLPEPIDGCSHFE